jgi:hypothetical protein
MRKRMKFGVSCKEKSVRKTRIAGAPRMYQQEWEMLKRDRHLALDAPVEYHARIVRMIGKEKDMDVAFKAAIATLPAGMCRLRVRISGSLIEFKLVITHY